MSENALATTDLEKTGTPAADGNAPVTDPGAPAAGTGQHQDPGTGATEQASGGDWTPEHVDTLAGYFAQTPGVSPSTVDAGREWWAETYGPNAAPLGDVKREHSYDFSQFGFSAEAEPYVNAFGNRMAARGVGESEVYGLVRRFVDELEPKMQQHQATQRRESASAAPDLADIDRGHAREVAREMRGRWQGEYAANVKQVNAFLDSLPETERRAIETETVDGRDGSRLMLNTPEGLTRILVAARQSGVSSQRSQQPAGDTLPSGAAEIDAEIAKLEHLMRTDRAAYNKQSDRYLALLRKRGA